MPTIASPTKEEQANLPALQRLELGAIIVVSSSEQADSALLALSSHSVLGFDTESKPTFARDQVSEGPHVVQFSTPDKAYVFQLFDATCRAVVCQLLETEHITKVGFGLAGDQQQILRTLGVRPKNVLDLNAVFRSRGYAKELGVRGAVAVVFNKRFLKSRKATTSNWSNRHLSESQIIYSANDAWASIQVYLALGLRPGA